MALFLAIARYLVGLEFTVYLWQGAYAAGTARFIDPSRLEGDK